MTYSGRKKINLFSVLITLVFQLQDLKLFDIKITEFVLLVLGPVAVILNPKIPRYLINIFLFFVGFLIISFFTNIERTFYVTGLSLSILKVPYMLSISRFLEFLSCLLFIFLSYLGLKSLISKGYSVDQVLSNILRFNYYFAILFILFFLITKAGFDNIFYYSTVDTPDRLKGFYVEGGPLGLFYGFLFGLNLLQKKSSNKFSIFFLIVIILAQSKAGILMAAIFFMVKTYALWKKYIPKTILITAILVIGTGLITFVLNDYLNSLFTFSKGIDETRLEDSNYVMGRISGMFITPRMILDNLFFGVGIGNYSLVRNNPQYLGPFPPVYDWDLQGLGGIISLVTEGGIIGLVVFVLIIVIGVRKMKIREKELLVLSLFFLPMLLGVQLYFPYQWFVIALAIIYSWLQIRKNKINNFLTLNSI